jgi:hypothetical protein
LVLWCIIWEPVSAGIIPGIAPKIATYASPLRAVWGACQPPVTAADNTLQIPLYYTAGASIFALLLCLLSVLRLRVWNPSRQVQPRLTDDEAERLASEELGTKGSWKVRTARPMWNNPRPLARNVYLGRWQRSVVGIAYFLCSQP